MAMSRIIALVGFTSLLLSTSTARKSPCDEVSVEIYRQFKIADLGSEEPEAVSPFSACHGMEATCCDPATEKKILPLVESAFLSDLQPVLNQIFGTSCSRIGQHFNRGLFETLSDAEKILTKEVREIFRAKPGNSWNPFDQMFHFLQEFVYMQNFCMLRQKIEETIKELVSIALENYNELDRINSTEVENHFVSTWSKRVYRSMLGYLYFVRNMEQALRAINALLQQPRQHQFSPTTPCANAIMRKFDCGLCMGYTTAKSCDGNCINTLRGCFVDAAEVQPLLKDFADRLQKFASVSIAEFHPVRFSEGALMDFIWLARQLSEENFIQVSQSGDIPVTEAIIEKPPVFFQPKLNFSKAEEYQHHLETAFRKELECMTKMGDGLLELPERMCGIDPRHTDYIRNIECWNGTAFGSYKGALVGHSIADQMHNPSFTDAERQILGHHTLEYLPQINKVNDSMTEIDKYIQLAACLESNDEDCGVTIKAICSHVPHKEDLNPNEINPTDYPPPVDDEDTENLGSGDIVGSGDQHSNSPYSGDSDNGDDTTPMQTEIIENFNLTVTQYEHELVVKIIPPYIRDSKSDLQSTTKPTYISRTRSKLLSSTPDIIRPSRSTSQAFTTPSNHLILEVITMTDDDEDTTKIDEEDSIITDDEDTNMPSSFQASALMQNDPSGSSSCYISGTVHLVSLAIICCVALHIFVF